MRKSISIAAVAASALLAAGCTQLRSRSQINEGVSAFKNAQFPQAVEHFKTAVELEPDFTSARLYLAVAYMQQYVPGSDAPDNVKMADQALSEFQKVLEKDPANKTAAAYIATLKLNEKKWDEAENWYKKVVELDPKNTDAYYSLGFIAWSKWYPAYATAMHDLKQPLDSNYPIKDKKVKAELKQKWEPVIQAGMDNLNKCLEIDPYYADAMAYENLLIRERAYLLDDQKEFDAQIATANGWIEKAMAAKKVLAEKKAAAAAKNAGITQDSQ
ncbi:MAG TPA: tetratricopeptide repeat protein [Bryobacteraceae bacterium]|jgi:tetratricopeptide (TPR) repeat protein|nr:tetratricopeptide repeat protein [Bryobacteraceae bacterium]